MEQYLVPFYVIDAYSLIYRAYFAFAKHPLRNTAGRNVSALIGFAKSLARLLDKGAPCSDGSSQAPELLAIAFDPKGKTFRHEFYPQYKGTRNKMPEELHEQIPLIEELLQELGIKILRAEGFEADDIIATLVERCKQEGRECYIFSGDKDLQQIVGNGVFELNPAKEKAETWDFIDEESVKKKWGVKPVQMLDFLSLTGDTSDNVPGVKGIGEAGAARLINRYGSLDNIYRNLACIEGSLGRKLAAGRESAYFSMELIKLRGDVPLDYGTLEDFSVREIDREAGARVLAREECREAAEMFAKGVWKATQEATRRRADEFTHEQRADKKAAPELLGPGTYRTVLDLDEVKAILEAGRQQGCFALDFETDSLDAWHARPIGISLAIKPKEAVYIPMAPHEGTAPFIEPELVKAALLPLFADPNISIIAHNAKYDYEVSRGWGVPRWQARVWDTMVAAWLLEPERPSYSLDAIGTFYFNNIALSFRDVVPKGETFLSVPLDLATKYSGEDADLCFRLKTLLEPRVNEMAALFMGLEMPLLPILAEMEGAGIRIEKPALAAYGQEMSKSLDKIQADIFRIVGHEFKISSTQQLQKVLFEERGLKPSKKTHTGFSTDMGVLEELAPLDPVPALILQYRNLIKLKSTYVDALIEIADKDDRIHTSFVQTGTSTGRLSSRDPNLQNIPVREEDGRRIREAFVAKPGHVLISADYKQIELVVLAHLSGDANLVSAFKNNKDVHTITAGLIFGVGENNLSQEQRRMAKAINFGVIYGMSAFRLAHELGITRHEASAFIDAYFKTYSGVRALIDNIVKETEEKGFVTTLMGRKRMVPAINSVNKVEKQAAQRVAVNTTIQGSAADIVKTAMIDVDKALAETASPAILLLQVHDELILEAPESAAESAALLVRECMENAIQLNVPLRVSIEIGKSWGAFH